MGYGAEGRGIVYISLYLYTLTKHDNAYEEENT